jgi:hypothetical protein
LNICIIIIIGADQSNSVEVVKRESMKDYFFSVFRRKANDQLGPPKKVGFLKKSALGIVALALVGKATRREQEFESKVRLIFPQYSP